MEHEWFTYLQCARTHKQAHAHTCMHIHMCTCTHAQPDLWWPNAVHLKRLTCCLLGWCTVPRAPPPRQTRSSRHAHGSHSEWHWQSGQTPSAFPERKEKEWAVSHLHTYIVWVTKKCYKLCDSALIMHLSTKQRPLHVAQHGVSSLEAIQGKNNSSGEYSPQFLAPNNSFWMYVCVWGACRWVQM